MGSLEIQIETDTEPFTRKYQLRTENGLIILENGFLTSTAKPGDLLVIGRLAPGNTPDIPLDERLSRHIKAISRRHGALGYQNGIWVYQNISPYGSLVDGKELSTDETAKLHDESIIKIGRVTSDLYAARIILKE